LRTGNQQYLAGQFDLLRIGPAARARVAESQHPFATVLTCSDSGVPPEIIFSQGLGDLFVVRVAGAVPDQAVLGGIEYAAEHLHVPLVVVMGHLARGAVKSAMESSPPIKPAPASAVRSRKGTSGRTPPMLAWTRTSMTRFGSAPFWRNP
jgi:carbonic anhydrase